MFPLGNMACSPLPPIPADMTRLDLTLQDDRRGRKRKHRTPCRGNPGSRRRAAPRLSRSSYEAVRHRRRPSAAPAKRACGLVEILGQAREHHALFDIRNAQTMWLELSNLIIGAESDRYVQRLSRRRGRHATEAWRKSNCCITDELHPRITRDSRMPWPLSSIFRPLLFGQPHERGRRFRCVQPK